MKAVLEERIGSGPPSPVQAFMDHGEDFIVERSLPELVRRMNALAGEDLIDHAALEDQIVARDRQIANRYAKDGQVTAIHGARAYFADKVTRVAAAPDPRPGGRPAGRRAAAHPHPQVAGRSADGPFVAGAPSVRRTAFRSLAAGEVAGFGGGGVHGYRALEGTFLGGCLFGAHRGRRGRRHRLVALTEHPSNGV